MLGRPNVGDAAVHHQLAGMMVERLGVHRADQGDVVGAGRQVRQEVGQLHAALAVLRELARAAHQTGALLLDEGEADVLGHRLGQLLAVQLVELGLGVEEVDLAGSAFEIDADARLGLGGEVRGLGRQWIGVIRRLGLGGEEAVVAEHRRQGQHADAAGRGGQEVAARLLDVSLEGIHQQWLPLKFMATLGLSSGSQSQTIAHGALDFLQGFRREPSGSFFGKSARIQ